MSADKYPRIFSRQMEAIVYIVDGNIANQIHGFTIDYGKFILICNSSGTLLTRCNQNPIVPPIVNMYI